MGPKEIQGRVLKVSILKPKAKVAEVIEDVAESKGLAALYNHYKVAFATKHHDRSEILGAIAATF